MLKTNNKEIETTSLTFFLIFKRLHKERKKKKKCSNCHWTLFSIYPGKNDNIKWFNKQITVLKSYEY